MKQLLFFIFLFSSFNFKAHGALLHKVDKNEILRTFEMKPFAYDPSIIEGKDLPNTRRILSEVIMDNAFENLRSFAKYADLPMSFARHEMTEARFKIFNIFLRKSKLEHYHEAGLITELNEATQETIKAFINRPHVDNYYDLKELVNRYESMSALHASNAQKAGTEQQMTFMGIPNATAQNIAVLALILSALSLVKSLKLGESISRKK